LFGQIFAPKFILCPSPPPPPASSPFIKTKIFPDTYVLLCTNCVVNNYDYSPNLVYTSVKNHYLMTQEWTRGTQPPRMHVVSHVCLWYMWRDARHSREYQDLLLQSSHQCEGWIKNSRWSGSSVWGMNQRLQMEWIISVRGESKAPHGVV